jgi:hypothetical protein
LGTRHFLTNLRLSIFFCVADKKAIAISFIFFEQDKKIASLKYLSLFKKKSAISISSSSWTVHTPPIRQQLKGCATQKTVKIGSCLSCSLPFHRSHSAATSQPATGAAKQASRRRDASGLAPPLRFHFALFAAAGQSDAGPSSDSSCCQLIFFVQIRYHANLI